MDWSARYNLIRGVLVAWQQPIIMAELVVLAILLLAGGKAVMEPLRRASARARAWLIGSMVGAFLVRAVWIPALSRHLYDGHEADYFDVWRGVREGIDGGYRVSELMVSLYRWGGPWFDGSGQSLVMVQILFATLLLPLVWIWLKDLTGSEAAGLWAGLLLTLDPVLGFWASSAYNIHQPVLLSVASLTVLERAFRRGSAGLLALALVLWATAIAARPEALLIAPPILWRLWVHRRLLGRHLPWWIALLGPLPWILWPFFVGKPAGGDRNPWAYMWEMFRQQILLVDYFRPYDHGLALIGVGIAGALLWRQSRIGRQVLGMSLAIVVIHHLAYAFFDDYGFRHTLLPRVALSCLMGVAVAGIRLERGTKAVQSALAATVIIPLVLATSDIAQRYYADAETFFQMEPAFQTAPYFRLETHRHCVFIAESGYYQQFYHASHFQLYSRPERLKLREKYGACVLYVYDLENFQASSRAIDGRALKIRKWFALELLGKRIDHTRDNYSLIYRVMLPSDSVLVQEGGSGGAGLRE